VLTEETSRRICTKFAVSLHTLDFETYVRTRYLATINEWRICIVISGWDQMLSSVGPHDLRALFDRYVVSETVSARWVVELSECHQAIPG
jgi:hypothetical protein